MKTTKKFTETKYKLSTIALVLVFTFAATLVALPIISAQTEYTNMREGGSIPLPAGVTPDYTQKTIAHLSVNPNPVGVGQPVSVSILLSPITHASRYFSNYTVIITDPNGTHEVITKQSYYGDATSWLTLTPDKVGTWKIEFIFPGGYFPAGNYTIAEGSVQGLGVVSFAESVYYAPSSDGPYDLTVQEDPMSYWPASPLPTDYWTRPVSPENREWWSILGYFPSTGVVGEEGAYWSNETNTYMSNYKYVPYVQGPNSAHIVWRRAGAIGGLIGGPLGGLSWVSGGGSPSIIYAGRCYQTLTKVVNGEPTRVWQSYDLRTGEVFWEQTGVTQVPSLVTYHEGYPETPGGAIQFGRTVFLTYVGGGRLINYDPYTGAVTHNVSIAPLSTGTLYANLDFPYFLSVQDLGAGAAPDRYRLINWTVKGDVLFLGILTNVGLHVMNNVTWPFSSLSVNVDYEAGIAVNVASPYNVGTRVSVDANITATDIYTGRVLWSVMADVPYNVWAGETIADHGKVAIRFADGHFHCWELSSGKKLWVSEISTWPWGCFGAYGIASYGGNIIVGQYDGVAAYDWDTGKVSWLYEAPAPYPYEAYYEGNYPFFDRVPSIADGKVYYRNIEHTPTQPLTRGWKLHCINVTTGEGIWNITWGKERATPVSIADGYLAASNVYDGYMYVFGKGPSATTVTAASKVTALGSSIMIEGTVTDECVGAKRLVEEGKFKSVPAISDQDMGRWMEYLYMQQPMPKDVEGVKVKLYAIDPNNNYQDIGYATTDIAGNFGKSWVPPVPGEYKIMAEFEGSASYGSSSASTYLVVDEAPSPATSIEPELTEPEPTEPTAESSFITTETAIIAAVIVAVIIGIAAYWQLRKRQ